MISLVSFSDCERFSRPFSLVWLQLARTSQKVIAQLHLLHVREKKKEENWLSRALRSELYGETVKLFFFFPEKKEIRARSFVPL